MFGNHQLFSITNSLTQDSGTPRELIPSTDIISQGIIGERRVPTRGGPNSSNKRGDNSLT